MRGGDTVLIKGGFYRSGNTSITKSGTSSSPTVIGSYGDSEVIIDGSPAVTGWTNTSGTIWQVSVTAFTPEGVIVNDIPLKEVPATQSTFYPVPNFGLAGVVSGNGRWFYDPTGKILYADFGYALGIGNPNNADVIVLSNSGADNIDIYHANYVTLQGLTIRGASGAGVEGIGSYIIVNHCNVKLNYGPGVLFAEHGMSANIVGDQVIYSNVAWNVLMNWPFGNIPVWSSGVTFHEAYQGIVKGNIVSYNCGEGIDLYGTQSGITSGSHIVEQNVVFNNLSGEVYLNNEPYDTVRWNLIYGPLPIQLDQLLYAGNSTWISFATTWMSPVGIGEADEQAGSDSTNNYANLSGQQIYYNVIYNSLYGIHDGCVGTTACQNHGVKNALIANNTIYLGNPDPSINYPKQGIYIEDNYTPSGTNRNANSKVENNIVVASGSTDLAVDELQGSLGAPLGITFDYNGYYNSNNSTPLAWGGTSYGFVNWKSQSGQDAQSIDANPLFASTSTPNFQLQNTSPAIKAGTNVGLTTDYAGNPVPSAPDIGAYEFVAPLSSPTDLRLN
ncbi:MAG: choice-of-anchor Q domain-containing protein [bacterium]